MYAGRGRDLVAVGQLNARFPMVIVTREPVEDFDWSWLTGRTVLVPGAGGTAPYEFTAGLMREHGADPARRRFVRDLSTDMLAELFQQGLGDAMVADLATARCGCATGRGHLACHLAARRRGDAEQRLLRTPAAPGRAARTSGRPARRGPRRWRRLPRGAGPGNCSRQSGRDGAGPGTQRGSSYLADNGTWSGIRINRQACLRWLGMLQERGLHRSRRLRRPGRHRARRTHSAGDDRPGTA